MALKQPRLRDALQVFSGRLRSEDPLPLTAPRPWQGGAWRRPRAIGFIVDLPIKNDIKVIIMMMITIYTPW